MKDIARKFALANAIKLEGKANEKSTLGLVMSRHPELKSDIKTLSEEIAKAVTDVNKMTLQEQKDELEKLDQSLLNIKTEKFQAGELKPLENATLGKLVMRFAPSPSGPLHIGHSYVMSINYEYVKKYGGKFMLRIEDTNSDNIYPDAYEMIPADANWLCDNQVADVIIQSNRLDLYYQKALVLFEKGHLYVDTDSAEMSRNNIAAGIAPPNRDKSPDEQIKLWKKMFDGFKEGEAVVRFKTDVTHKNPAMRDFPVFRINDSEHPKQGKRYRVWPLMNFSVAIDDIDTGVTHAIRGKDHADNAIRQEFIQKALGANPPIAISLGRINYDGFDLSTSGTRKAIDEGQYEGWDDIRIPFLLALRKRGYTAHAFRRYAKEVGVTKADKTTTLDEFFKAINAFNKEIIDKTSSRFFIVRDAKEIFIEGTPKKDITLNLHPDKKTGGRDFDIDGKFIIEKEDYQQFAEGKIHRLMDCINFTKEGEKLIFHSFEYEKHKENAGKIIHWLTKNDSVTAQVLMPNNQWIKGIAEKNLEKVKTDDVIQFERFGFARCDKITSGSYKFYFAHK